MLCLYKFFAGSGNKEAVQELKLSIYIELQKDAEYKGWNSACVYNRKWPDKEQGCRFYSDQRWEYSDAPGAAEVEITATSILAKVIQCWILLENAMDADELIEIWEANLAEPVEEEDNKFMGMYFSGISDGV